MSFFTEPEYIGVMASCFNNRGDDAPILALADFIDERTGYQHLAEFIRLDVKRPRNIPLSAYEDMLPHALLFQKAMSDLDCLVYRIHSSYNMSSMYFCWNAKSVSSGLEVTFNRGIPEVGIVPRTNYGKIYTPATHDLKNVFIMQDDGSWTIEEVIPNQISISIHDAVVAALTSEPEVLS